MPNTKQVPDVHKAKKEPAWRTTDLQSVFGVPVLLEGENETQYKLLADRFRDAVQPRDFLEAMWVDEITKHTFVSWRYHRAKTNLMRSSAYRGVEALLGPLVDGFGSNDLAQGWARRDASTVNVVDKLLKAAGRSEDDVAAQTLAIILDHIERIEALQGSAEERRNKALREVARHREMLARQLRQVSDDAVQDVESMELNNANENAA